MLSFERLGIIYMRRRLFGFLMFLFMIVFSINVSFAEKIHLGQQGWVHNADGSWSYGDENGDAVIGRMKVDWKRYWFDEQGKMYTGWFMVNGKWYYAEDDGCFDGAVGMPINGAYYWFDKDGAMLTGWYNLNGFWLYLEESGAMRTQAGWFSNGGKWYYMVNDIMTYMVYPPAVLYTGWLKDGNNWYLFDTDGEMIKGWSKKGGKYYYFLPSGEAASGWQQINGSWYFFGKTDTVYTDYGWLRINGKSYHLTNGLLPKGVTAPAVMCTGWKEIDGKWEKFSNDGAWQYTWDGK